MIDRNDSCPAVSQICNLICLLSMVIIRAPNSTPIVRSCSGRKRLSVKRKSKQEHCKCLRKRKSKLQVGEGDEV